MSIYYLEYEIIKNRPGLLGDVASLLGLLNVNIVKIASIEDKLRGMLIEFQNNEKKQVVIDSLNAIDNLKFNLLRKPLFLDYLAIKHGKKLKPKTEQAYAGVVLYSFYRDDLHLLIDFLSGYLEMHETALIGFIGNPRIGKTETAIAAAVHANKHWQLLSTTLLRKIARTKIADDLVNKDSVFIIDAITSFQRSTADHIKFIKNIVNKKVPRIVEHPDIFIRETDFSWPDFDLLIELTDPEQNENNKDDYLHTFSSFDIS